MNMTEELIDNKNDIKLSQHRTLHLMFLEDWWYEIATFISKDKATYDYVND
jgi:hypothetical protein